MGDQVVTPIHLASTTFRTVIARARLRVRRWTARRRRRESLAELSDWILRDIGVTRERDMASGLDADPREAASQFWRL